MAAGDISKSLLARVRVYLDETVQAFWQDTDIYTALTDGQVEAINFIMAIYHARLRNGIPTKLPEALIPLENTTGASISGTSRIPIPTDMLYDVGIEIINGDLVVPAYRRDFNREMLFLKQNSLLNSNVDYFYYPYTTYFNFIKALTCDYIVYYIKTPPDISATADPSLTLSLYNAIVLFATSAMLKKDERLTESGQYLNEFLLYLTKYMGL